MTKKEGFMKIHHYWSLLQSPLRKVRGHSSTACDRTYLDLDVPAVDDLHDAHHVVEHQAQLVAVVCQRDNHSTNIIISSYSWLTHASPHR
jgi:hypothetical protein